jgi:hypothetical protein
MAMQKTRKGFIDTQEGRDAKQMLQSMVGDSAYNTSSSYSTNSLLYPDNLIPFVDKHMNYLINHPSLEAGKYLANIKLITKLRYS